MTTSKRAAGDLSGVPRSDSKRNKGWLCSVSGTDGVIVIIFYGDCAFASSPGTITSPFVRLRSLGDSFFHKEGDGILAPFATRAILHKKHLIFIRCFLI